LPSVKKREVKFEFKLKQSKRQATTCVESPMITKITSKKRFSPIKGTGSGYKIEGAKYFKTNETLKDLGNSKGVSEISQGPALT